MQLDQDLLESKKIMIYFGGSLLNILEYIESENVTYSIDELKIKIKKDSNKIIKKLSGIKHISNIRYLFEKDYPYILFNPIYFEIKIPYHLQDKSYKKGYENLDSKEEDFFVILDLYIMMIGSICDLDKRVYGPYDVRDEIKNILKEYIDEIVAPCLTHEALIFQYEKKTFILKMIYIYI